MRLVLISALLGCTLACGSSSDTCTAATATKTTSVSLTGFAFSPTCLQVTKGDTVTFTNQDSATHTVTSLAGQVDTFDSGNFTQGQTFQHTFSTAGTIKAKCNYHPMSVTVIVN